MTSARTPFADHFVFTKKAVYMQRIGDLVRSGHSSYVQGRVDIEKAGFLVGKFEGRYSISRTKLESSRARRAGKSSTRLLLLLQEGQGDLDWVLLHVHGVKLDSSEKWRDAISDRVTVTGYELVRLTKPDEPRPVWTWRYTKSRHDELRNEIIACIRQRKDRDLVRLIETTWRTPGFYGAREQVKKFKELILSEWRRSRGAKDELPDIPVRIGYLRRLSDVGLKLSTLRRQTLTEKRAVLAPTPGLQIPVRTQPTVDEDGQLNWFAFLGRDTRVEDLNVDVVARLEEIVARRMRHSTSAADIQVAAHEWLTSFLGWPQPRFMCSRPADIVVDPRGLVEVIRTLGDLPDEIFQ